MQSGPSDAFHRPQTVEPFSKDLFHPTQHGQDFYGDSPVSGLLCEDAGDSSSDPDSSIAELSLLKHTESSPAVDRVSEHENTAFGPSRRQSEFGFKVTLSSKQPTLSFDAFPNEVLTHILSHLPPASLSSVALVSRRLHSLVTTPHAWRIAFSRYFPGPSILEDAQPSDRLTSDRRHFSRLTALASWRSEYILRTRLLRSLARGKPAQLGLSKRNASVRSASVRNGSAIATYTSQLLYPVSHLAGTFGGESAKKEPLFIHGASEQCAVTASAPSAVKVGTWGLADHNFSRHFADSFPGEAQYGLGSGNLVGVPNSMDVSQPYGMIYGEGCPQGRTYYISTAEQRGRFLGLSEVGSQPSLGIPAVNHITTAITAVWIAKSPGILKMTGGLFGLLAGSSSGILNAYALGPHPTYEKRFERGQATARWVLSPGVPIVGIAVDENYSLKRHARRRVWAAVLNALGEVFYLSDIPQQSEPVPANITPEVADLLAWKTGRSVRWELVEVSRRIARPDPFNRELVDGSYSPRSSSDSMKLSDEQIAAETKEIEQFLSFKPKHFRKVCECWDMRRDLQVDFAGDDGHGAGESFMVIQRGNGENDKATIRRYTRKLRASHPSTSHLSIDRPTTSATSFSIFGGPENSSALSPSGSSSPPSRASSQLHQPVCSASNTEWFISDFNFGGRKSVQATTSALDLSTYALLTPDEDLLLMSGNSESASVASSPLPHMERSLGSAVPGRRARYMAVGTATGSLFVWDIRSSTSKHPEIVNSVSPIRTICTDSPQVSCVALTSLYLVHGGNDGLVQAWDPLASTTRPIRTINSRFSSRARRRLVQAEASIHGVGNNYYATGAICLDPDPTSLRGMVALGTHLRYWSYSSSAADQYKSNKRRLRHSHRGTNLIGGGQRFSNSGRGAILDHIEDEKLEMKRQELADQKERAHLSNRFGIDLLGPDVSENDLLAYAQLLSQEAYSNEAVNRGEPVEGSVISTSSSDTIGPNDSSFAPDEASSASSPCNDPVDDDLDPDIAEAIRLSLLEKTPDSREIASPFSVKYSSGAQSAKSAFSAGKLTAAGSSRQQEIDDLDLAIRLSLVETHTRNPDPDYANHQDEEFPSLPATPRSPGKNKGKARMVW
ncbi:F-box and WD domain protein [Aspergillus lucknowensis]|uniref:F-box domain-containing protein n=1 Tax=Aspergillus lucknowensis TaxID=176173 RepID=A0ABR4LXC6_9EURO